ncbi:MAG: response regulator [Methylococcales bacterium]|nr:response regulator [Methylococcales bacterium]
MSTQSCVFIVDDDDAVRDSLGLVMEAAGFNYQAFESAEHFLKAYCPDMPGCLLLDVNMPGMNGNELQAELIHRNIHLPIIFLTAHGDIPLTVRVIKAGAVDFLTKPIPSAVLIERIQAVLQREDQIQEQAMAEHALCDCLNSLTSREWEVLPLILEGHSNKQIARHLGISYRTIEIHRARIMKKTGVTNLMELARLCETCKLPPRPQA